MFKKIILRIKIAIASRIAKIVQSQIDESIDRRAGEFSRMNENSSLNKRQIIQLVLKMFDEANVEYLIKGMPDGTKLKLRTGSQLTHYIYSDIFEEDLLDFSRSILNEGDIFIDVGANAGLYTVMGSKAVGTSGSVFSFEPTPTSYNWLQENIKLNNGKNVKTEKLAIGEDEGEIVLNISTNGMDAWNSISEIEELDEFEKIKVSITSLDRYIQNNIESPDLIKLIKVDVEGWELPALRGAENFLLKFAPTLIVEFTETNAKVSGFSCSEIYNYMVSLGYLWFTYSNGKLEASALKEEYPYQNLIAIKNKKTL